MAKMEKGNTRGVRFSSIQQPPNRGRKKSRLNQFVQAFQMDINDEYNLSREDIYKLMAYLLSCSKTELEKMARHPDLPIAIVCQIKGVITDLSDGKTYTVDRLFDRLYGRSMQPMEITGTKGIPLIPDKPMSRKAYEKLLLKLQGEG